MAPKSVDHNCSAAHFSAQHLSDKHISNTTNNITVILLICLSINLESMSMDTYDRKTHSTGLRKRI